MVDPVIIGVGALSLFLLYEIFKGPDDDTKASGKDTLLPGPPSDMTHGKGWDFKPLEPGNPPISPLQPGQRVPPPFKNPFLPLGPSIPRILKPLPPIVIPLGPQYPPTLPLTPLVPSITPLGPAFPPFEPLGPAYLPLTPLGPALPPLAPLGPARFSPLTPLGPALPPLTPLDPAKHLFQPLTPCPLKSADGSQCINWGSSAPSCVVKNMTIPGPNAYPLVVGTNNLVQDPNICQGISNQYSSSSFPIFMATLNNPEVAHATFNVSNFQSLMY